AEAEGARKEQTAYLQKKVQVNPTPIAAGDRPRVYSQAWNKTQIETLQPVLSKLREAGYRVPGTETVSIGPTGTELRYFRNNEKDTAQKILVILGEANLPA